MYIDIAYKLLAFEREASSLENQMEGMVEICGESSRKKMKRGRFWKIGTVPRSRDVIRHLRLLFCCFHSPQYIISNQSPPSGILASHSFLTFLPLCPNHHHHHHPPSSHQLQLLTTPQYSHTRTLLTPRYSKIFKGMLLLSFRLL